MQPRTTLLALCLTVGLIASGAWGAPELQPEGCIEQWVILGPFPNPLPKPDDHPDPHNRGGFDTDYLISLGGESKARIRPDTTVTAKGPNGETVTASAQPVHATNGELDFVAHFNDSSYKLAYAYTEIQSPRDQEALFMLGSDDGARVWVNGKQVFEWFTLDGRACAARQDRFKARLHRGVNTVLVKVENGIGDWALILEAYGRTQARKIEVQIKREEVAREFRDQELTTAHRWPGYVIRPGDPPKIIWRDVDRVRELVGDIPLKVRWFDGELNEVPVPDKPGRYAAFVEGKMPNGTPVRRAMTFYAAPPELNLWTGWDLKVPYVGDPIDPEVWKEQSGFIDSQAGDLYRCALETMENGAWLLAALAEAKPGATEPPDVVNDAYQLALKLKLMGITNKTRPLATPKQRTGPPAPVLHEGTPAEAGVRADAKEKIDTVCRQWAEDSGEPFSILVARHGVIITHEAFGKSRDGVPVTLDYRTQVASITKCVTGMLFSQFLDQGFVKLDDPIGNCLPDFPTTGEHALTYRHLFTHTSGLTGHGEWGGIHNPYLENVILGGIECLHPGQRHIYNGMGYDLSAKAMEIMTGKSLVRLMHDNLFNPLGIPRVPVEDCAYGARLTSLELGKLAQLLANHGSYGDKQFISEDTFEKTLPEPLDKYYPGIKVEWGIGLTPYRERRPATPAESKDPKDLILGEHVVGHGSATACVLRVDLDNDLIIAQVRRTGGPKYGEYLPKFLSAVADSLL